MTRPRLLLDEMLSGLIAAQLRDREHDVIAVVDDPALVGMSDADLLAYSASEGRTLVTANVRDFAALNAQWAAQGRDHAGLVYIVNRIFPQNASFLGAVVTALDHLLEAETPLPSETYLRRPAQDDQSKPSPAE